MRGSEDVNGVICTLESGVTSQADDVNASYCLAFSRRVHRCTRHQHHRAPAPMSSHLPPTPLTNPSKHPHSPRPPPLRTSTNPSTAPPSDTNPSPHYQPPPLPNPSQPASPARAPRPLLPPAASAQQRSQRHRPALASALSTSLASPMAARRPPRQARTRVLAAALAQEGLAVPTAQAPALRALLGWVPAPQPSAVVVVVGHGEAPQRQRRCEGAGVCV